MQAFITEDLSISCSHQSGSVKTKEHHSFLKWELAHRSMNGRKVILTPTRFLLISTTENRVATNGLLGTG